MRLLRLNTLDEQFIICSWYWFNKSVHYCSSRNSLGWKRSLSPNGTVYSEKYKLLVSLHFIHVINLYHLDLELIFVVGVRVWEESKLFRLKESPFQTFRRHEVLCHFDAVVNVSNLKFRTKVKRSSRTDNSESQQKSNNLPMGHILLVSL